MNEMTKNVITETSSGIKVEGHRGSWYVLERNHYNGNKVFLLEHERYGEDAPSIIVDQDANIVMEDVYNGFSDLWEREN